MLPRLTLYTFGIFIKPSADPANAGFHARNDINLAAAEQAAGFIARSGHDGDPGPASWGAHTYPRFYTLHADAHSPSTLSLWRDAVAPQRSKLVFRNESRQRVTRAWIIRLPETAASRRQGGGVKPVLIRTFGAGPQTYIV